MSDFAALKAEARALVHDTFAVAATYTDSTLDEPADVTVRWHSAGVKLVGDLEGGGFAEVVERIDRIVFNRVALAALGISPRRGGTVTLTAYTDAMFTLDNEEPADGPVSLTWTVSRAAKVVP